MTSPFRTNASLGPDLYQVVKADNVWYDGIAQVGSPQLGDVAHGDDGRQYVWVEASGSIAVGASYTQVAVTYNDVDDVTAATGTGGFYTAVNTGNYDGTIAAGDRLWVADRAPLGS